MNGVVVAASVALAWCFPDEASNYADDVLIAIEGHTIFVPAVWGLEITNAVLVGERSKRLGPVEIRRFAALLDSLSLVQDVCPVNQQLNEVLPLARDYGLSAYDAAYLEVSVRRGVPLATREDKMRNAARRANVEIFIGGAL